MSTVFNQKNVDSTKEYMFFGEELNTQRFDRFRFPKFNTLTEQQLGFFWRPQEVSLQKDISDFKSLSEHEKFIFSSTLKFQTLLDSLVGRGPFLTLLPIVSLPELESCITTWGFFEAAIHSRSYSYIMQNVYTNPTEVMDSIMVNEKIIERAQQITHYYDDLINATRKWQVTGEGDLYELKKKLFLVVVNTNILEGIRFYGSFACNFALAENKLMEGSAKILALIARDENVHMALTTHIIQNWRSGKDDPDFIKIIEETEDEVKQMFLDVMQQEREWAEYIFKDGSIIGLNARLLSQYIDYMGVRRAKGIGYKLDIDAPRENPLPWMEHWLSSKGVQAAPQQTEISTYQVGAVKQDIDTNTFGGFSL